MHEHTIVGGPGEPTPLLPQTVRTLTHRLARTQAECRLPSLIGAVVHDGALKWTGAAGLVDGVPPTTDTRYRIGSITKTFTAVLVLRLRDQGRLDLADPVGDHVPNTPVGDRTIASLLAHTSGLQAETAGDWWERTGGVSFSDLLAPLDEGALVHPADRVHHYSNLGYAVLGELVQRHRGVSWMEALRDEVLRPLELHQTSYGPETPHADGFAVHPWADLVLPEPAGIHDAGSMAPAGQLWASITDLARWARFLAGDTGDVLDDDSLEEMRQPIALSDDDWSVAHGLGVQVFRRGERRWVGHGGSMPGFLALVLADPDARAGSCVAANATAGIDGVCADLLDVVLQAEPRLPEAWAPAEVPEDVLPALGPWYWGPTPLALRWRDGHLRITALDGQTRESRFVRDEDGWIGLDGYYRGERLRLVPDDAGGVSHLELASFVFTRAPYDPEAPVPGGVDADGWR